MGVTGLWTVVQPCARPIKLETLNKKRLAVDASIWIYQFLKAVRDKEGNALRNSHVVGFFRRICKLLFFGIKPVFVFDGGAPILKRQTVSGRKARREGRREDAVRTAGKLLAVQMQRRAEEDDRKRREERDGRDEIGNEEEVPDNPVYVDELQMTAQERQQSRAFKKRDAYHLPNLDVDLADMGAPNDPRVMSHEELEEYARQFHTGEDVNIYDFSKIDFNSPFFLSLPASDRYNILNAARLRSRLRMGYSKEQLDTMFPNRMAFSKFQIDRVKERNELTQRLMNINGMNGEDAMFGINDGGRVAGEKGKEYVLVKNDGVEGGWALGVVSNKGEGDRTKPIDVEGIGQEDEPIDDDEGLEDDGFEDIPIEGLNGLPKRSRETGDTQYEDAPFETGEVQKQRQALYKARMVDAGARVSETQQHRESPPPEEDSLFVASNDDDISKSQDDTDALFEDVIRPTTPSADNEDAQLNQAIAMSLEHEDDDKQQDSQSFSTTRSADPRIDRPLDFNSKNAKVGRDFAHLTNARAHASAPNPFADDSDNDDDLDLQAALQESRSTKYKPQGGPKVYGEKREKLVGLSGSSEKSPNSPLAKASSNVTPSHKASGFDGPLPFESINLGTSILGKKKMQKRTEEQAGGFEKDTTNEKPAQPLPPWFSGDIREAAAAQRAIEEKQLEGADADKSPPPAPEPALLRRQETGEIIDLDAPKESAEDVVEVESSADEDEGDLVTEETAPVDAKVRMGDVADLTRAEPPPSAIPNDDAPKTDNTAQLSRSPSQQLDEEDSDSEAPVDWSESDLDEERQRSPDFSDPAGGKFQAQKSKSSSPEFQDVSMADSTIFSTSMNDKTEEEGRVIASLPRAQSSVGQDLDNLPAEDEEIYSDPEEEDLMRQLAVEAEEHARFASSLNAKSQLQNAEDYEKELRQLRNQQKKDRRDADEVTHIMVTECQQLLKLFGLPYITAPMEAEAQCAELVALGLVDGIVTDDSDIFLFGGTRIYKNMFNQAKFVECYLSSDLEKEYSLDRRKLIRIAHLLGSDYTEGLPNVGPVTALEILSEFETLEQFAEWWSTVQMGQKLSAEDAANPFRRKFRKNAAKLFLPALFPDTRVDHAYLNPEVDRDPSAFQWGVPDLDALRSFLMATIGWSQERTDEVLVPVIKDMNRRENEGTQANITRFFEGGVGLGAKPTGGSNNAFAPRRRLDGKSKRMEIVLGRLHEQARNRTHDEGETSAGTGEEVIANTSVREEGTTVNESSALSGSRPRKSKKRVALEEVDASREDSSDDDYQAAQKRRISKKSFTQR
ncbi:DNA repair protein rad2 [Lecanora helva]